MSDKWYAWMAREVNPDSESGWGPWFPSPCNNLIPQDNLPDMIHRVNIDNHVSSEMAKQGRDALKENAIFEVAIGKQVYPPDYRNEDPSTPS